jgi:hypothetical protein
MVSVLKNIQVLCGPVLKSAITEITPFELRVAEKQCATTMEKLDSADSLRCISEEERRAVFEALQSEDALACYNRAGRARRLQLELEATIDLARRELAAMRRRTSEEAERKAAETRASSSELAKEARKARREARAGLEQARKYYVELRRKHGVRNGFSGFPKGHSAFMENLTDIRRLHWRTARRLYSEYEQNMRGNAKAAREAWQKLELLRSVGRARSRETK